MNVLEYTTREGESPVVDNTYPALDSVPKYRGTRETLWEAGRPTSQD
jgi:hypothetical protein